MKQSRKRFLIYLVLLSVGLVLIFFSGLLDFTEMTVNHRKGEAVDEMHALAGEQKMPLAGNPRSNNWPIPTSKSNWLMFSSAFFLIPGAYGAFNGLGVYGVVSTITTLISMAHWWDAQEFSRRRAVDLVVSKVSFAIYLVTGCFFIRDAIVWAIGIPGCIAIIYCFYMSGKAWEADSDYWYIYHMLFHFTVACEQALVLYATILSNGEVI